MNLQAWRYYTEFYKRSYLVLILGITVAIIQPFILLPIILLIRHVFDVTIPARNFPVILIIAITILFLHLLSSGAVLYSRYIILKATKRVIRQFRDELLKTCYALSRSYLSGAGRGGIHSLIVQDTERLDVMSNALIVLLLPSVLTAVILSCVLLFLDWPLFFGLLIFFLIAFLFGKTMGDKVKRTSYEHHRAFETFSAGILSVLQKMDLTRIQSAENFEIEKQRKIFEQARLKSGFNAWLHAAYAEGQKAVFTAGAIFILIVGGISVAMEHMTIGELLAFYIAIGLLKNHLSTISVCIPQIIEGNQSLSDLHALIEEKDLRPYSGVKRIGFRGKVVLKSVHFRYNGDWILKDVSLTVEPGKRTAIVGPNGAGKSTIVYLILGFYRPQKGCLYFEDHPLEELDVISLRRQIGVITQDPMIFPGTIFENITYGCPDVSMEEVIQKSEVATAHEFIQRLPREYETPVGEGGVLISGGQRQRIAIARALLNKPKLLILDEPTNNLDYGTSVEVVNNLQSLSSETAVLVISHVADIVNRAHQVYRVENGRILRVEDTSNIFSSKNARLSR